MTTPPLKILTILLGTALTMVAVSALVFDNEQETFMQATSTSPLATSAPTTVLAPTKPTLSVYPEILLPGNPLIITINATTVPTSLTLDDRNVALFMYDGSYHALSALPFNDKRTSLVAKVRFADGEEFVHAIPITPRPVIERPLGIPEKLGGNTPEAGKNLISNLSRENTDLASLVTATTTLWQTAFSMPLENVFVTDDYGYNRNTVDQTIPHLGTDFRATIGTPVYAMNDGVVRRARSYIAYGNAVVVDHGLGLQTLYMHLSELRVKEGETVVKGQLLSISGDTGYADAPHLHISIKIGGVSIDPMVFLGFFGLQ